MAKDSFKIMDNVLSLSEVAAALKLPAGSVRLGRHDARGLVPIRFSDSPNAPLYYKRDDVAAILRRREDIIKNGGRNHAR